MNVNVSIVKYKATFTTYSVEEVVLHLSSKFYLMLTLCAMLYTLLFRRFGDSVLPLYADGSSNCI